ncbi:serine hydrolase [Spirosoma spitsbergense]|uniref:serine hydrolase n=1 Tax=Spirosoma spitsbergense TaxID=431554 RepID=UPI000A06EEBC|nr:serine hydrolase [Spirosoma spitsbergense]
MTRTLLCLLAFVCSVLPGTRIHAGSPERLMPLASNEKSLLSFSFLQASNPSLPGDVSLTGTIESHNIITLPAGTNVSSLKPAFTLSAGAKITVNGVVQTSDASVNDFTKPVVYRITAEDGSTRNYTIEVSMQVDIATVEDAVKAFMTKYSVPGLSIAITKDERLIYAKGYGMADKDKGEPITTNSLFRMASISKSITARAVLKLVDDGKLSLDQKVFGAGSLLGTKFGTKPYTPQLEQITVRQLLNHTAGGDPWTSEWDYSTNTFDPFYQKEWIGYTNEQVLSAVLDNRPVTQTPGSKFVYSNIGINVLGRIIEKVTGIKYEKYVQDNLLKPIGIDPSTMKMGGTTLAERFPNEVVYYNPYPGYDQPYDFPVPRMDAHSGWITTAINMARLLAFTDGYSRKKDILSSKSIQDMYTPSAVSIPQSGGIGYGLGCYTYPTSPTSTHRGGMAGTATVWWRFNGYLWVILLNTRPNNGAYLNELDNLMNPFLAVPASSLMKGDQFDLYYGRSEPSDYCTPMQRDSYSCSSSDGTIGIESVKIWSAGKASVLLDSKGVCSQNGNAYSDLTGNPAIKLTSGTSFPFQVDAMRIQSGASKDKLFVNPVSIWVDLDQNKVFTDDERVYYTSSVQAYPNPTLENQFTIPATAKPGLTRMRIRLGTAFTNAPETPCEQIDGETEDYLVNIISTCPLSASIAGAASICPGTSTTLTASATGGQGTLNYAWKLGNTAVGTNSPTLPATATGTYSVSITDASSGCAAVASFDLTVSGPTPTYTGAVQFCSGASTVLSASASGGKGPYAFNWKRDGLSIGQATSLTLTQPGSIVLEATDQAGCVGRTNAFTVSAKPAPVANAGPGATLTGTELYRTESVTTAQGGTPAYTYQWQTTPASVSGNNATTANPTFGPFTTTTTITLTVGDQTGCSSTTAATITYVSCSLTAGVSGTPTLCGGASTKLTALTTNGNGALTYEWKRGNTVIGTAIDQTISTADSYSLRITDAKGCSSGNSFSVSSVASPAAQITASSLDLLPNGTVSLSANTGAGLGYQWNLAGSALAGATASIYPARQPGVYTVSVSKEGCTTTSPGVTINLITAIEPATPGSQLSVSPNPSSGQATITLTLDKPAKARLSMTDATGQNLHQWNLPNTLMKHDVSVDFSPLAPGIYFIKADIDGRQMVKKVVKE